METDGTFRHELKYPITNAEYLILRSRLSPVMRHDAHTDSHGRYTVESLYFDTPHDKALREKIDGVSRREKFRIRFYNGNLDYLSLEKKSKVNSLCQKKSALITKEELFSLLAGDTDWMREHESELARELGFKMQTERLFPRVLVSYVREAYVYAPGNVRVTFDFHIRSSVFSRAFFESGLPSVPVCDPLGQGVLEVKYDEFLPDIIRMLLQTGRLRPQAFSKYALSRRFG